MSEAIPFNRPWCSSLEYQYVAAAIRSGHHSGDGTFTRKCHAILETLTSSRKALLTTSGTHALEMAAILLDVDSGDEVILPSFTFVSTANAFVLRGAKPVFIDVRLDTLNLDERLLPGLITPRTRAIVPVHYAGVACEMDSILAIARTAGVAVVEDNAHGLLGHYRGRPLGSLGSLAAQSFHETKNLSCGEGGALLINDPRLVERAEVVREKGTNRTRYFRGEIDKYGWVGLGSSYLPSEMLAAFLLAQLEQRAEIQARRRHIWVSYATHLSDWAERTGFRLPTVPDHCDHPSHLFYLIAPSLDVRSALIAHLKTRGIMAVFHYQPLSASVFGMGLGGREGQCPVAEDVSRRLVRLPLFAGMTVEELDRVVAAVLEFC